MSNQEAKFDAGKPQLRLVPTEIINNIAKVREYGVKKYKDPENWKRVEIDRYKDACYRHWLAYINDPHGLDEESGLPHLYHVACNIAFLCELEKGQYDTCETININGRKVTIRGKEDVEPIIEPALISHPVDRKDIMNLDKEDK